MAWDIRGTYAEAFGWCLAGYALDDRWLETERLIDDVVKEGDSLDCSIVPCGIASWHGVVEEALEFALDVGVFGEVEEGVRKGVGGCVAV